MIPKQIKIAGNDYTVLTNANEYLQSKDCLGECGYIDQFIKVRTNMPQQRIKQAFIHEMVHLMLFEAGFIYTVYDNEKMVRPIANILYQILRDNKFDFMRR